MTPRNLRRWRERYERWGYNGLVDQRRCPSKHRVPMAELERVLQLYRERYRGFNGRHFHEVVRREHGVTLSYSYVKQALQQAGLLPKRQPRGRHRRRREPRACCGELLHLDGSPHAWLALVPDWRGTLITVVDDATTALLYAQLWEKETIRAVMSALAHVLRTDGLPMALYTDRAGWAFHTPQAGGPVDKSRFTQVGRALRQLGIEHIPAYSPQARGRSERMNRTLQGRVINELRGAGITTAAAANQYLHAIYLPQHNATFRRAPRDPATAFVPLGRADLDAILCQEDERVVAPDNTVTVAGQALQLARQRGRQTCAGLRVLARQHLDGTITIIRPPAIVLGAFAADGQPIRRSRSVRRTDARPGCPRNDDRRRGQGARCPPPRHLRGGERMKSAVEMPSLWKPKSGSHRALEISRTTARFPHFHSASSFSGFQTKADRSRVKQEPDSSLIINSGATAAQQQQQPRRRSSRGAAGKPIRGIFERGYVTVPVTAQRVDHGVRGPLR